jgi:histidinol-phosphate/aromatic aminotransferase/cobyric acid decarboxylase-like protein
VGSFPLADWINANPDAPHHLAHSGMVGSLRSLPRALRDRPAPEPPALRRALARIHGVSPERVFLTHGASEGNSVALLYLARETARAEKRTPRLFAPRLEYPPIPDTARAVGFRRVGSRGAADVVAFSAPRNPEGTRVDPDSVRSSDRQALLVDQTFREFSEDAPWTRGDRPNLWLTGSFTKIYGADRLRVGYVIPPEGAETSFGPVHGLVLDLIPHASVSGALAILAHRAEILEESRALFRRNERALRAAVDGVPPLSAPVWFDRGPRGLDGDRLQREALRSGVLVCSGSFFGDPTGVRICLTRRTFPADLEAYLAIRARFLDPPPEFGRGRRKRAGRA